MAQRSGPTALLLPHGAPRERSQRERPERERSRILGMSALPVWDLRVLSFRRPQENTYLRKATFRQHARLGGKAIPQSQSALAKIIQPLTGSHLYPGHNYA